jgi:hypothetical protein
VAYYLTDEFAEAVGIGQWRRGNCLTAKIGEKLEFEMKELENKVGCSLK